MRIQEQSPRSASPNRFVVLVNPVSTNARRIGRQLDNLEQAGMPIVRIESDKDPRRTRDVLSRTLAPEDWWGIGSGDGMVNFAVTSMLEDERFTNLRNIPLVPLAGGNANDIAHMLHSRQALRQPRTILEQGEIVSVHPLRSIVTPADGETSTTLASGYISFGASGRASHEMNKSRGSIARRIPGLRRLHVGTQACKGMVISEPFKLEDTYGVHTEYERVYPNGKRMAQFLRWQTEISDDTTQEIIIKEKRLSHIATSVGRSLFGQLTGPEITLGMQRSFTLQDETYMECDGEDMLLTAGSHVTVDLSPESFYAVTTRSL